MTRSLPKKITEAFFLLTTVSIPLYMVRFEFLTIPTNILEFFAILSIILFLFNQEEVFFENFKIVFQGFAFPIIFLLLGLFFSLFHGDNFSWHGLGIIKSWFVIPILFSAFAAILFKNSDGQRRVLFSIYISFLLVSVISLSYRALGYLTFDGRLSAFYLSPNHLSMFLVFGFFIFPYISWPKKNNLYGLLIKLSLIPILLSLYFTFSYSVWLSAAASFFLVFLLKKDFSKKTSYALFGVLLFSIFFILQAHSQKFAAISDPRSSTSSRIMIWDSSFKMILDNPVFGIGPGNFQSKYLDYQKFFPPYLEWAVPQPHNIFLAFWLQAGILGLLAFLMLCYRFILSIIKNKNTEFSAVFLGMIFYILIQGLFDTPFWKNDLSYIFWLVLFMGKASAESLKLQSIDKTVLSVKEK